MNSWFYIAFLLGLTLGGLSAAFIPNLCVTPMTSAMFTVGTTAVYVVLLLSVRSSRAQSLEREIRRAERAEKLLADTENLIRHARRND